MDNDTQDGHDSTPIKPVSSLRSHFEKITTSTPKPRPKPASLTPNRPPPLRSESQGQIPRISAGRRDGQSLEIPRLAMDINGQVMGPRERSRQAMGVDQGSLLRPGAPGTPRQRPISMGPLSPYFTIPAVTVDAPTSSTSAQSPRDEHSAVASATNSITVTSPHRATRSVRESTGPFKIPPRPTKVTPDPRKSPFLGPNELAELLPIRSPFSLAKDDRPSVLERTASAKPPPINRAEKPIIRAPPPKIDFAKRTGSFSMLAPTPSPVEDQISPFNTPPGSDDESSPGLRPDPISSNTTRVPQSHATDVRSSRQSYFDPPPMRREVAEKRRDGQFNRVVSMPPPQPLETKPQFQPSQTIPVDTIADRRPGLPPRPETSADEERVRSSGIFARSSQPPPSRLSRAVPPAKTTTINAPTSTQTVLSPSQHFPAPPKRQTSIVQLEPDEDQASTSTHREESRAAASRMTTHLMTTTPSRVSSSQAVKSTTEAGEKEVSIVQEYPDTSNINRRKPYFKKGTREIQTKHDTRVFAVSGKYVVSTGHLTRAWSITVGHPLMTVGDHEMSLSHGENIRVTSIAFKATGKDEEEGTQLWLGTNQGEIIEVDIPSQSLVDSRGSAHPRREVIKIYRNGKEMWSLDDEGKLHLWPPDETGTPNLRDSYFSFRVPRGHTFSLVSRNYLWLATGKEIRVFEPSTDTSVQFQVLAKPLSQPGTSDVTSGAVIDSQPDRVYFGHMDGKVSVYSQDDFACLGIFKVSDYRITALAGVGDHIWAGYVTGMLYVYDTTVTPWRVKKDWHAHTDAIIAILADPSSLWELNRFQVASLGAENSIRLWDGMLQEDWLENELQCRDVDYCSFREIRALVMTWNAGASTPGTLKRDDRDSEAFKSMVQSLDSPDILVFGFQELVDLEDKKMTAKSFFKSSKKKDAYDQENMSHQYRDWRDYLTRLIDDTMSSAQETYTLLHTSNMIGLFTCIFVKTAERRNIRNVQGGEVKCGMGGLHGNKGALICRFVLDDSSLCFINCHLAAGQTQTTHRNNDIANILEATALPMERDPSACSDLFIGGGDGCMILDHEICILNGDLNYRIDTMGRDTVVNAVKSNNLGKLLDRDQLLLSRKRNPGFRLRAFKESQIAFAPTYKYDVGSDRYDTSEKRRSPAWCDRVLYRGLGRIKPLEYRCHNVRVSDHRPVTATFRIRVKSVSPEKKALIRKQCEQRLKEIQKRMMEEAR